MLAAQKSYAYEPIPEYRDYKRKEKNIRIVTVTRKKAIFRFKAIMGVLIFFAVGMFILSRYSLINEEKRNINKLKTELAELNKTNTQTQIALNRKVDLEQVEIDAIKKLGMQYPDNNQTVYIQIPKTDFTEVPIEQNQMGDETGPAYFAKQLLGYLN